VYGLLRSVGLGSIGAVAVVNLLLDGSDGPLVEFVVLEKESQLLEGAARSLGVQEVDNEELESDPTTIDSKVLPLDGVEGDGVDVGGEETSKLAEDLLDTDTARSLGIGPKFDKVGVCESVVTNVVGRVVGEVEDQGSDTSRGVPDSRIFSPLQSLKGYCHSNEDEKHKRGRQHVHVATLEAGDDEGDDGGVDKTPAGVGDVDTALGVGAGVAHHVEENVGVVAEQGVAGQLGEEADEDGDVDTATHTGAADKIEPGLLRSLHLSLDGLADLDDFGLDERRRGVALGVVLDQDGSSLLGLVLGDKETRGLGKQEDGGDLENRWADLEKRRQTPSPVAGDVGVPMAMAEATI